MEDNLKKQPTSGIRDIMCSFCGCLKKKFGTPRVAVLRLQGVIGHMGTRIGSSQSLTFQGLADDIEAAFSLPKCKAVVLVINSPGGSPVQSELIYKRIRDLSEEKDIPVIAFVEDVAASGGYWLACAADEIYASQNSILGSIGVVASGFGFQDAIKKLGIERRVYTQGNHKTMLDAFQPIKEDDVERLYAIQKDVHESFKALVSSRRQGKLSEGIELFDGDVWTGSKALEIGLIDGLADMHALIKERFGDDIQYIKMGRPKNLLKKLLGGMAGMGGQWAHGFLEVLEEKAARQRVGL